MTSLNRNNKKKALFIGSYCAFRKQKLDLKSLEPVGDKTLISLGSHFMHTRWDWMSTSSQRRMTDE